jgi:hypothetical protein
LDSQRAIGNRATSRLIQAALTVSRPGDHCEQEADRVAAEVAARFGGSASCAEPERLPPIGRAPSTLVSRSAGSSVGMDVSSDVAAGIDAARGSGQALPERLRSTS